MRKTLLILMGTAALVSTVAAQTPAPAPAPMPPPKAMKVAGAGTSFIGVMIQEIDSERAKTLKLREEAGVEVTRVENDSPAERGGLKVGDVVMQYNGQRVEGMEQFSRMVRETPAGRDVKLEIVRNGAPQTVVVKVGARKNPMRFGEGMTVTPAMPLERFNVGIPDIPRSFMSWRSSAMGFECESLEGQLAQYFGVKEGVLVRSVSKNSAAEKAGIKAGDVITRIDDGKVASPADISNRIRALRGKPVPVVLIRDHKEMTLNVTLDEEDRSEWWQSARPRVVEQ
jgi:serine protease Do